MTRVFVRPDIFSCWFIHRPNFFGLHFGICSSQRSQYRLAGSEGCVASTPVTRKLTERADSENILWAVAPLGSILARTFQIPRRSHHAFNVRSSARAAWPMRL